MENVRKIKVHVEVPFLMFGICLMYETSITPNFMLYRTCYVTLGYDKHDCSLLGTENPSNSTKQLETEVQAYTTQILLIRSIIEAFIPPLLCLFFAPWSDKYGRKPTMLLGITSLLMSYLVMTVVSALPNISPWYFLLLDVPLCIGGSNVMLMTACLSYVTDVTKEQNTGIRLGFLDAAINLGMLIGTLSSSYIFTAFGYPTIYVTCVVCQFIAWIFTFVYIKESIKCEQTEGKWRALFDVTPLKETLKIMFKERPNNDRAILLCFVSLMALFTAGRFADSNVIYLYLLKRFNWTLHRYTLLLAISTVTWTTFCLISVILITKVLRLKETSSIIVGTLISTLAIVVQGLANQNWHIYAAITMKSMGSFVAPVTQLLLSRVASKEEIGKMFATLMALQTVSLLFSSSLNILVYNKTLEVFPQAFNFVTGGLYGLSFLIAISVNILQNQRNTQYSLLVNECEEDR